MNGRHGADLIPALGYCLKTDQIGVIKSISLVDLRQP